MKTTIRKIAEPVLYLVLVSAFGLITTAANHTLNSTPVSDSELVSLTIEKEIESIINQGTEADENISL